MSRGRWGIAAGLIALAGISPRASTKYIDLEPGWSTKADAARVLGAPVMDIGGVLFEHAPQEGTGPIFVELRLSGGDVVERIEVRFRAPVTRQALVEGLKLPASPQTSTLDRKGALVEYYGDGLALVVTYASKDASSGAVSLGYHSDALFEREAGRAAKAATGPSSPAGPNTPPPTGPPPPPPGPPAPPPVNTVPPSIKRDPLKCYDLYLWAEREQEAAKRARMTPRRQLAIDIRITAQSGDCGRAGQLAERYKALYGRRP